jgi:hypothetical protein
MGRLITGRQLIQVLDSKYKEIDQRLNDINEEFHFMRYNRKMFDMYMREIKKILVDK